ncbi:MAG: HNH endonuclease [Acidobacteriota bacterium]|nr:HNH endonuclease [Acidobacteriota bacterium]
MIRKRLSRKSQLLVRERARGCCEYCLCQEACATERFSVDHIIPLVAGGGSAEDNLALACQGCNGSKYDKTRAIDPTTGQTVPLYHPRKDDWHEHFTWNSDCTLLIGLTPTGRITVEELELNREGVINLRQVMSLAGKHPPVHRSSS